MSIFFHLDTCSQVSSLQETNRKLNKETEEKEKQLQLMKMREESLTKLVRDWFLEPFSAHVDLAQLFRVKLLDRTWELYIELSNGLSNSQGAWLPHGYSARLWIERSVSEPWPGTFWCVLGKHTLLSQCFSPPRCINGCW